MWEFFIKNSKFAYLFLIALIGIGSYSLISIPKESAPEVVVPIGVVSISLPGAPAADIESLITNEIERGLTSLENVKKITSTSRESVSSVMIEFDASADLDKSIADLKDQVDKIKTDLPTDATEPVVLEVDFVNQPILTIALSADISDFAFTQLSDDVQRELESVAGVSRVELSGIRDREVTVIVDQVSLQRFNISLSEITNAISSANLTFPIGQIVNNGVSYNVAFEGDIEDSTQIKNIGITNRGGQPIYIKDLATVEDGLAVSTLLSRLSVDGEPSLNSVTINVYKQSGGDITTIAAAVNKRVTALSVQDELLDGVTAVTVLDAGKDIRNDLVQLSTSGLQTVILVVLLLMLAIGWREGLLAGAAIPLSFLFGFIGLYFSGNTINFLSLFSLILGIGILVDSAIVMIEGINKKMKDEPTIDKREAAITTIREFKAPLIAGTLTTVSMFVGLFIVSGVTGQFIASIPFTLIFLLFASLFVALAILPLIASTFLKRRNESVLEEKQAVFANKFADWYRGKMELIVGNQDRENKFLSAIFSLLLFSIFLPVNVFAGLIAAPLVYFVSLKSHTIKKKRGWSDFKRKLAWIPTTIITIMLSVFVAGILLPSTSLVKVIFFEQSNIDFVIIEIEEPEGTTKEVTDISVRRVEEILYAESEIDSFTVTVGSGSQFGSGGTGEKFANIFVNLDLERERTSTVIVDDLRRKFLVLNDIKVTVNQPSDGPPTGAAIIVKFLGDDLTELTTLANGVAKIFKNISNTVNVETSTNNNSTEFVLELNRDKAAALGVSPLVVSQIARTALFGTEATSLTTLDEDIDVIVKLNVDNVDNPTAESTKITSINALSSIIIPTQSGQVPLSTLATVALRESSSVINHEDSKRVVTISADASAQGNAREIQAAALVQIEEELNVPADVIISTGGGETEDSNRAFIEMGLALIVGIALMVCILTLQFNSYLHMRYVLSILPYSLIGILSGLAITQSTLSFPSMMGFIALSGIVVNNSILLIDMMNKMRKANPSKPVREVVLDAAANRLRPILLTTITTVFGMVPLTYAGDLWAPLAYSVMFGLVFSVIITLVLIPITYSRRPGEVEK
ncbi:MAG: multidrug efflux pump subunit AcrB [Candidatus Paceibacteria bacterium]|jgi:multidrug efflux pump subunit AcrB